MEYPSTEHEKITQQINNLLETHCSHCFKPKVADEDWDKYDEGEAPHLCWEMEGFCTFSPTNASLGNLLAPHILKMLAEAYDDGGGNMADQISEDNFGGRVTFKAQYENPFRNEL